MTETMTCTKCGGNVNVHRYVNEDGSCGVGGNCPNCRHFNGYGYFAPLEPDEVENPETVVEWIAAIHDPTTGITQRRSFKSYEARHMEAYDEIHSGRIVTFEVVRR